MERLMRIGAGTILGASVKRQQASREYKYNIETERAIQKAAGQRIAAAIKRQQQPSPAVLIQKLPIDRTKAATKIQTAIRKQQAKRKVEDLIDTRDIQNIIVPAIQSAVRGRIARKKVQVLRAEKKIRDMPATKIAKTIKGAVVRKTIKPIIENFKKEVKDIERDKLLETTKAEDRIEYEKRIIATNKVGAVGGLFTSKEDKQKKQKIVSDAERAIKAEQLRLKNIEKKTQNKINREKKIAQKKIEARTDKDYNDIYKSQLNSAIVSTIQYTKERKIEKEKEQRKRKEEKQRIKDDADYKQLTFFLERSREDQQKEIDKINTDFYKNIKPFQEQITAYEKRKEENQLSSIGSVFTSSETKKQMKEENNAYDFYINTNEKEINKRIEERKKAINNVVVKYDVLFKSKTTDEYFKNIERVKLNNKRNEIAQELQKIEEKMDKAIELGKKANNLSIFDFFPNSIEKKANIDKLKETTIDNIQQLINDNGRELIIEILGENRDFLY
jgi:hypothetical protein